MRTRKGYVVKSESGRVLSRAYPTLRQAVARLREIEYFAAKAAKAKAKGAGT